MAFGRRRKQEEQEAAATADAEAVAAAAPPPPAHDMVEIVTGGTLRRIVFEGASPPAETPAQVLETPPSPAPSPAASAGGQSGLDLVTGSSTRRMEFEGSDRLSTRTIYESSRGSVRESRFGSRSAITVGRRSGGVEHDSRFLHSMVDKAIADLPAAPAPAVEPVPALAEKTVGEGAALDEYRVVVPTREPPAQPERQSVAPATEQPWTPSEQPWSPSATPASTPSWADVQEPAVLQEAETVIQSRRSATSSAARRATRKKFVRPVARRVKRAKKAKAKPRTYSDFPGDNHEVIDIEGIGPKYSAKLKRAGVYTTARLCYEKPAKLAKRIKLPVSTVKQWRAMAEMMKVKGVGAQYAEVMARAGIKGIDQVKKMTAPKLSKKVTKYLATVGDNPIGHEFTPARAKLVIKPAMKMRRVKLPVPHLGAPETTTVRGGRQVVAPLMTKAGAKKAKAAKARKAKAAKPRSVKGKKAAKKVPKRKAGKRGAKKAR